MSHSGDDARAAPSDRRVRRTRAALREALLELVVERGYDAVTVQDVIDRADVGRSTFYSHYRDKDDLLEEGLDELRCMLVEASRTGPPRRWLRFSPTLLEHLSEMRLLVRAVFAHGANTRILTAVQDTVADLVTAELAPPGGPSPTPLTAPPHADVSAARIRFAVGAYVAVLAWWLTEQPHLRAADVDAMICALVVPGLERSAHW